MNLETLDLSTFTVTIPVTYLRQEYIVKLIEQIPTKSSQDSAKVQLQKQVDIQPSKGNDGSIQHSCLNVKTMPNLISHIAFPFTTYFVKRPAICAPCQ